MVLKSVLRCLALPSCLLATSSWVPQLSAQEKSPAAPSSKQVEFFERNVRPVLLKHCVSCHGSEKQENGLRLDTRQSILMGGESGPAITSGQSKQSLLVEQIGVHDNESVMPPDDELNPLEIANLTKWIDDGAPWPIVARAGKGVGEVVLSSADHWAFLPLRNPALPAVAHTDQVRNPIDLFILSRLESADLTFSPPADRVRWLRRVTIDLTGIPPTLQQIKAFESDKSPKAFERVVDRLLDSSLYGQRWARHWLDVARYGDTKGYVFQEESRYAFSYTYRDFVVRAFNQDMPYNEFLRRQIAADLIGLPANDPDLAAMGFLTLGNRFLNKQHDIIDDQIDLVSRGILGLTLACARCHDHKLEPLVMADYYSMYSVFANSVEPAVPPLIGDPHAQPGYDKYVVELEKRQAALDRYVAEQTRGIMDIERQRTTDYLILVVKQLGYAVDNEFFKSIQSRTRPPLAALWATFIQQQAMPNNPVFSVWRDYLTGPKEQFAKRAEEITAKLNQSGDERPYASLNPLLRDALRKTPPKTMVEVAEVYGRLLGLAETRWRQKLAEAKSSTGDSEASPPSRLADDNWEMLRLVLYVDGSPFGLAEMHAAKVFDRKIRNKVRELQRKVDKWSVESPQAPARAMVMNDRETLAKHVIFERGNPARRGAPVDAAFPKVLSRVVSGPFEKGSGRLGLAEAVASPKNPLTARVWVNRIWAQLFQVGIVRSTSNFGTGGDVASHPELLDYLSVRFIENAWSTKALQRMIVLSATYRQSSLDSGAGSQSDPDNRLLWKMNRRRLDFEAMRDSMLAVTGQLDTSLSGKPVDLYSDWKNKRRTIYGVVNRNDLPGLLRTFDFPSPNASSPGRINTSVPQQALFGMNSRFVRLQAERLFKLPRVQAAQGEQRVGALYEQVLGRDASADERKAAMAYVRNVVSAKEKEPDADAQAWQRLAQVLLMTNEFMFVD